VSDQFEWAMSAAPVSRTMPLETLPPSVRRTRWRKTPTTFGPTGRLSLTLALLVPLPLMLIGGLADPFVWGGAGFWAVVVMPLALRDIWKAGQLPLS
jgi:hypothetical protein